MALLFTLVFSTGAWAHAGHDGADFAAIFQELLREDFHLPSAASEKAELFIDAPDGRRLPLRGRAWDAVRKQAATVDVPVAQPPSWRAWLTELKEQAKRDTERLLRRVMRKGGEGELEVLARAKGFARGLPSAVREHAIWAAADVADLYHRHGLPLAISIGAIEAVHASLELVAPGTGVLTEPVCKVAQGACVFLAKQTQEYGYALATPYPGLAWWERVRLVARSRRLRAERVKAYRTVFDANGMPVEVAKLKRTAGAELLRAGCFRAALGRPDQSGACTDDHAAGLRYKMSARAGARSQFKAEALRPKPLSLLEDLDADTDLERAWRTEDVIDFLELKLAQARLAAGDAITVNAPAFRDLRKRVQQMHKALDLYAYTLRVRALGGRPRGVEERRTDVRFDSTLTHFLNDFSRRLNETLLRIKRPEAEHAPFGFAPGAARTLVRDYLRGSCEGRLAVDLP